MINYLQVEQVSKSFGENTLFENISFSVGKDQKIALIAKNGMGKTTLIRMIMGQESIDLGKVTFRNDIKIGYLPQDPDFTLGHTILEELFRNSVQLRKAYEAFDKAIHVADHTLDEAVHQMEVLGGWDFETRVSQILSKLNIADIHQRIEHLSGGQKKRVALAQALIEQPDLLILDEPTNHLDLVMIEWLEEFLTRKQFTLLMVTHDRYFLDHVCTDIIELEKKTAQWYRGNYAYYLEKRQDRLDNQIMNVERARNLLKTEQDWMSRMPQARATKAKSRIDAYYKLKERASESFSEKQVQFDIKTRRLGNKVLVINGMSKSIAGKNLISNFSYTFARGERIGIIGPNGVGKSTFLNVITGGMQPDSGTIEHGETVVSGYYRQEGMQFKPGQRVIDVVSDIAEVVTLGSGRVMSVSQFLEHFLFNAVMQYSYVEKLSGGERRRLYLMTILMRNPNLLILDEPTNDLDIMTLNVLEDYLIQFAGSVVIVSHDRFFMDKVVDQLFVFEGEGNISTFPGNYADYRDAEDFRIKMEKEKAKPVEIKRSFQTPNSDTSKKKLSYKEQKELEQLEAEIENFTQEKTNLEDLLNSGTLKADELMEKSKRIAQLIEIIDEKEFRWLELNDR